MSRDTDEREHHERMAHLRGFGPLKKKEEINTTKLVDAPLPLFIEEMNGDEDPVKELRDIIYGRKKVKISVEETETLLVLRIVKGEP
jgi:hypothetical protein